MKAYGNYELPLGGNGGSIGQLVFHVVSSFSALGRVILHCGAMSGEQILKDQDFVGTTPHVLHQRLLAKARTNLANGVSILRQYGQGSERSEENGSAASSLRPRLDSSVRFANAPVFVGAKDSTKGRPPTHRTTPISANLESIEQAQSSSSTSLQSWLSAESTERQSSDFDYDSLFDPERGESSPLLRPQDGDAGTTPYKSTN